MSDRAAAVLVALFIVAALGLAYALSSAAASECEARGGTLVTTSYKPLQQHCERTTR